MKALYCLLLCFVVYSGGCVTVRENTDVLRDRPYGVTRRAEEAVERLRSAGVYRRTPNGEVYEEFDRNKNGRLDPEEEDFLAKIAESCFP